MPLQVATTRQELRDAIGHCAPGLVPTMGALHAGHLALIARAASENPQTVVSLFVNPTQFTHRADFDRYPRNLQADADRAEAAGANFLFVPVVDDIYPPGFDTTVQVGDLAQRWEGASRPGHFGGVATVVTILLNLVRPARSYFGEKDYQQLQLIRRLHRDLALPGEIVGCPTVRDADGLALSSRNGQLSPADRARAAAIPRAIDAVFAAVAGGERDGATLRDIGLAELAVPGVTVDYVAVIDGESLEPVSKVQAGTRVLVAAEVAGTRLIDNAALEPEAAAVS